MLSRFWTVARPALVTSCTVGLLWLLVGPLSVQAQEIPQNVINQACTTCSPTDVHTADLDGDGDPDILTASAGDNKIAWYENLDSGGFSEQKVITTSATNASSVFAADIDGDQDADVLATHNSGDSEETQAAWYENLDSGGFSSANPLDTGGNQNASSIFATDIDGDNDPDVVVGFNSFGFDQVVWHENLDDGGLSAAKTVTDGGDGSKAVYAANLDGDGDKDIISADDSDQIEWYENLDDGGFSSANVLNSNFIEPTGVHAADFDGDGDQDIIGTASADVVVWFENLDSGGFSDSNILARRLGDPADVHVADFNGDGDPDITIADSFDDDVTWIENLGGGSFSDPKIVSDDARTAVAVTTADVDGDGAADILSASQFEDKIAWHENQLGGSGGFSSGTAVNVIPDAIRPSAVHTAALDDDGDQDVLYATFGDEFSVGKIAWHENTRGGGFSDQNAISTQVAGARSVVAADLDGDDDQDILFGSSSSAGIGWFENLNSGGFSSTQNSITSSVSAREVVAADLDGDDDKDVLYVSGDAVEWIENIDDGGFESAFNAKILTDGLIKARSVVATDIGDDNDLDVIAIGKGGFNDRGRAEAGKLVWFENQGSGSFSSGTTIDDDTDEGRSVSVADVDGDGDKDIVAGGGFATVWYENLDDGGFSTRTEIGGGAKSVRTEDVNGDGAPDVLVAGAGRVEWIPNLGGGEFGEPDTISTDVQDVQSVFSANLDDDNDPDILSASFEDDKVAWYENTEQLRRGGQSVSPPSNLTATATDAPAAELTWDAVGSGALAKYRLYRSTGPLTGSPGNLTPVDSVGAGTTTLTDAPAPGDTYYYRVTAVDTAGTESGFSGEARAFLYPSEVTASVDRSFGGASDSTDYRLVALPGRASRPLADAIGGQAGTDWQAYRDDGSEENFFVRYSSSGDFAFEAGNGFWLTATDGWTNTSAVSTVELRGDSAATIPLRQGWNVISNPTGKDVAWSQVQAQTPDTLQVPFGFDGTFSQADTFRSATAGVAYYFLNDDPDRDSLVIPYPGAPGTDAGSSSKARDAGPSLLALTARPAGADAASASTVRLGLSETARAGLGPEDLVAPPGRFAETSLRIEAPGEPTSKRARFLMTERRPAAGGQTDGQTFRLRLTHRGEGPVQLSASIPEALKGRSIALLNPSTGTSHDLRAKGPITVDPDGETARLEVAVGSKSYVDDRSESVRPEKVRLTSYPNPVRQQGTVAYALPEASEVTLRVYDVLGRRVATLAQGRKEAGRHTATLETSSLSSGVYFGRLQAGGRTLTRKITVVR